MLIKKDKSEELEKILAQKNIDEQAKNLLQGILYKIEASYKDYKIIKAKNQTEEKYVSELLVNIDKKCNTIKIIKLSQKVSNKEIQEELEKNKYYVGKEIVSYPIEEKILYAIEKKSRNTKILNNKYEEATTAVSNLINTGKNMDRVEVLRDFNGWSWRTIKKELENIEANLIYQTLQIILGEEFLDNWIQDKDGIIDYLEQFAEETNLEYMNLLVKIAIANEAKQNTQFAQNIIEKLQKLDEEIEKFEDTEQRIIEISNHKMQILIELKELEKILGQKERLKSAYEKRNEEAPIDKKIFNIKVFKNQLDNKKIDLLQKLEKDNYLLNPTNYLEEKNKLIDKRELLLPANYSQEQVEKLLIEFVKNFLKHFKLLIQKTEDDEEIVRLIYKFRYFMLLPFNLEKSIKDVEMLELEIEKVQEKLLQKAVEKKIVSDISFEIMKHVFYTRIIKLEDLYYKIERSEDEKYYVQIFDENVSDEKFEIKPTEKIKINKKIKIFM